MTGGIFSSHILLRPIENSSVQERSWVHSGDPIQGRGIMDAAAKALAEKRGLGGFGCESHPRFHAGPVLWILTQICAFIFLQDNKKHAVLHRSSCRRILQQRSMRRQGRTAVTFLQRFPWIMSRQHSQASILHREQDSLCHLVGDMSRDEGSHRSGTKTARLTSNQSEAASQCDERHEEPLAAHWLCRHPSIHRIIELRLNESLS